MLFAKIASAFDRGPEKECSLAELEQLSSQLMGPRSRRATTPATHPALHPADEQVAAGTIFVHRGRPEEPLPVLPPVARTGVAVLDTKYRRWEEQLRQQRSRDYSAFSVEGLRWLERGASDEAALRDQRKREDAEIVRVRREEDEQIVERRREEDQQRVSRRQQEDAEQILREQRVDKQWTSEREEAEASLRRKWRMRVEELCLSLEKELQGASPRRSKERQTSDERQRQTQQHVITQQQHPVPPLQLSSMQELRRQQQRAQMRASGQLETLGSADAGKEAATESATQRSAKEHSATEQSATEQSAMQEKATWEAAASREHEEQKRQQNEPIRPRGASAPEETGLQNRREMGLQRRGGAPHALLALRLVGASSLPHALRFGCALGSAALADAALANGEDQEPMAATHTAPPQKHTAPPQTHTAPPQLREDDHSWWRLLHCLETEANTSNPAPNPRIAPRLNPLPWYPY